MKNNTISSYDMFISGLDECIDEFRKSEEYFKMVEKEGSYVSYMQEYNDLYNSQFEKVKNIKKEDEYQQILEKIKICSEFDIFQYEERLLNDNATISLILRSEYIISDSKTEASIGSHVLSEVFANYKDYIMEVEDKKKIKISFTIKLYDEKKIADYEDELEELSARMKILSRKLYEKNNVDTQSKICE